MMQTDRGGRKTAEANATNSVPIGCGFGRCRPHLLQFFANPIAFMGVLSMYSVMDGAIASGKPIYATKPIDIRSYRIVCAWLMQNS